MKYIPEELATYVKRTGKEPYKAYSVDNFKPSWKESAQRWANIRYDELVEPIVSKNIPKKLTLVDLECRGEGGRAYKVVDDNNLLFDLREDMLLDTIKNEGIKPGGELGGTYVWSSYSNQMKLLRVGSELHKEFVESTKHMEFIKRDELEIGRVYKTKMDRMYMFLGFFDAVEHKGYGKFVKKKNAGLFISVLSWELERKKEDILSTCADFFRYNMNNLVRITDYKFTIPDNVTDVIRNYNIKEIMEPVPGTYDYKVMGKYIYNYIAILYLRRTGEHAVSIPAEVYERCIEMGVKEDILNNIKA